MIDLNILQGEPTDNQSTTPTISTVQKKHFPISSMFGKNCRTV
jgi:hypothetical protein